MHHWEVYITRGAEGKAGRAFVGSMTEEKSIELASKLASEGFVFTVRAWGRTATPGACSRVHALAWACMSRAKRPNCPPQRSGFLQHA